eukprot:1526502-Prymnesium_polylepis.1
MSHACAVWAEGTVCERTLQHSTDSPSHHCTAPPTRPVWHFANSTVPPRLAPRLDRTGALCGCPIWDFLCVPA